VLNAAKSVTILGGAGTAGAHAEVMQLAEVLQSPIVHALRGKKHLEYENPFDVGGAGDLRGHGRGVQSSRPRGSRCTP
jgi:pyruvate dehydrogenase (quinone)